MRFHLQIGFLILSTMISGCATTSSYDGFESPHKACYAFTYGDDEVDIDYEKALHWCYEGVEDGSLSSLTLLAELHYNGSGTPKDIHKASRMYELAAEHGHVHAQLMVFLIYVRDLADTATCEQKLRGLEYLIEAAESGSDKANKRLAIFRDSIREIDIPEACLA
jgi:TPR repeat protein